LVIKQIEKNEENRIELNYFGDIYMN